MASVTEAIILAGGLGTRLKSVVRDIPKPMADVCGRPFLSYLVKYLSGQGVKRVILSAGYRHEVIKGYFGTEYMGVKVDYAVEDKPLGTGGAVREAIKKASEENILVLNGDSFLDLDIRKFCGFHTERGAKLTIAVKPMRGCGRYGTVDVEKDMVVGFKEKAAGEAGCINAGVYVLRRDNSALLSRYGGNFSFETDFLKHNHENTYAFICDGYFIDIGIPEDYIKAQTELTHVFKGE